MRLFYVLSTRGALKNLNTKVTPRTIKSPTSASLRTKTNILFQRRLVRKYSRKFTLNLRVKLRKVAKQSLRLRGQHESLPEYRRRVARRNRPRKEYKSDDFRRLPGKPLGYTTRLEQIIKVRLASRRCGTGLVYHQHEHGFSYPRRRVRKLGHSRGIKSVYKYKRRYSTVRLRNRRSDYALGCTPEVGGEEWSLTRYTRKHGYGSNNGHRKRVVVSYSDRAHRGFKLHKVLYTRRTYKKRTTRFRVVRSAKFIVTAASPLSAASRAERRKKKKMLKLQKVGIPKIISYKSSGSLQTGLLNEAPPQGLVAWNRTKYSFYDLCYTLHTGFIGYYKLFLGESLRLLGQPFNFRNRLLGFRSILDLIKGDGVGFGDTASSPKFKKIPSKLPLIVRLRRSLLHSTRITKASYRR